MFKGERNFKIQFCIFVLTLCGGFYFQISTTEWLVILCISALVFSLEIINSSIEKIGNYLTTDYDEKIKNIKDISAAAVLMASIMALIIGAIIFLPYLTDIFFH